MTAFASLSKRPVELSLAEEVLRNVIPNEAGPEITAPAIMLETAKFYSVTIDDLTGQSRSRTLVTARQVAMYLCRELTDLSLPKIGELFGGRDHTTVMHADRKIRQLMAERRSLYNSVMDLTARIRASAGDALGRLRGSMIRAAAAPDLWTKRARGVGVPSTCSRTRCGQPPWPTAGSTMSTESHGSDAAAPTAAVRRDTPADLRRRQLSTVSTAPTTKTPTTDRGSANRHLLSPPCG